MAACPPESRHRSAIYATEHLVLVGEDEVVAVRALRLRSCLKTLGGLRMAAKAVGGFTHLIRHFFLCARGTPGIFRQLFIGGKDGDDDSPAANDLLLVEIRDLDAQAQFDALIHADLQFISANFAESLAMILRPPTLADVDDLIARHADGSLKQQRNLLTLLSILPVELTDTAWSWVERCAKCQDNNSRGFAFRILTHADPVRFGQMLEADGWSWKSRRA